MTNCNHTQIKVRRLYGSPIARAALITTDVPARESTRCLARRRVAGDGVDFDAGCRTHRLYERLGIWPQPVATRAWAFSCVSGYYQPAGGRIVMAHDRGMRGSS
jgi:hypothetical protein